jgi:site-specific DNA recombinase
MGTFEKHNVAFVSVTQQFNSATPMGRLMMNVLLSFAQFEREIIGERTRDKIAAAKRRGKWSGGMPLLGYDVDPETRKLQINESEAARVRGIFGLYIEHESLLPVVQELERRGWTNKRWKTRKGHERGGKGFTRTNLHRLLTNVAYIGRVRHKGQTYEGEHKAIVPAETWQKVQAILQRNRLSGGSESRNRFGALLKGLIHCVPCRCAMSPSHSTRKGSGRRYRYYVCSRASKVGWDTCLSGGSIPAGAMEGFVVDQIRAIGSDEQLIKVTVEQAKQQSSERTSALCAELRHLERDLGYWSDDERALAGQVVLGDTTSPASARLRDLQTRIRMGEARATAIRRELNDIRQQITEEAEVRAALADFDLVWQALSSHEQRRLLHQIIKSIDYDGGNGRAKISFHDAGILALAAGLSDHSETNDE